MPLKKHGNVFLLIPRQNKRQGQFINPTIKGQGQGNFDGAVRIVALAYAKQARNTVDIPNCLSKKRNLPQARVSIAVSAGGFLQIPCNSDGSVSRRQ